jgi:beta-galactosidase
MKRKLISIFLSFAIALGVIYCAPVSEIIAAPFDGEEWYDKIPIVHVNREPAHAFFIPYQDAKTALDNEHSALTRDFSRSDYYMLLNGEWDFKWVSKPAERIDNFASPALDISG